MVLFSLVVSLLVLAYVLLCSYCNNSIINVMLLVFRLIVPVVFRACDILHWSFFPLKVKIRWVLKILTKIHGHVGEYGHYGCSPEKDLCYLK